MGRTIHDVLVNWAWRFHPDTPSEIDIFRNEAMPTKETGRGNDNRTVLGRITAEREGEVEVFITHFYVHL